MITHPLSQRTAFQALHRLGEASPLVVRGARNPKAIADTGPSGVALSQDVADLYVVMRFAELLKQRRVHELVERAISADGGNGGYLALHELAPALLHCVDKLATGRVDVTCSLNTIASC